MTKMPTDPFTPPTAQQVKTHLERHPARGAARWMAWLPALALALMVFMLFSLLSERASRQGTVLVVLGAGALIGLSLAAGWRGRRVRDLAGHVARAEELAAMRRYPEALRAAWRLVPRATRAEELHLRLVAIVGHVLFHLRAYDAALAAYDHLCGRLPPDQPGGVQVRIHRATAHLALDHLLDADEQLRQLRGRVEPLGDPLVRASYRMACLVQQVTTHHYADAALGAPTLLDDLRPLGVEAGYGHALMALSLHESAGEPAPGLAAQWWSRATLLLPVSALVARFAALGPLSNEPAMAAAARSAQPPQGEVA